MKELNVDAPDRRIHTTLMWRIAECRPLGHLILRFRHRRLCPHPRVTFAAPPQSGTARDMSLICLMARVALCARRENTIQRRMPHATYQHVFHGCHDYDHASTRMLLQGRKTRIKQINIRAESLASYLRCVMRNSKDTIADISSNRRSPKEVLLDIPSILNAVRDAMQ